MNVLQRMVDVTQMLLALTLLVPGHVPVNPPSKVMASKPATRTYAIPSTALLATPLANTSSPRRFVVVQRPARFSQTGSAKGET